LSYDCQVTGFVETQ